MVYKYIKCIALTKYFGKDQAVIPLEAEMGGSRADLIINPQPSSQMTW